jgi:large subunit ribosomal protein LP0
MSSKKEKKAIFFEKVAKLFAEYQKVILVSVDNVSSSLMQKTRRALRGKAVMLMGKNTLIRRALAGLKNLQGAQILSNALKQNVGMVFTNGDLSDVRDVISQNKISGPAKPGQVAPCDVVVPKGNTGLEPSQTSFLQALNIATKITKGSIEILNDVKVITKGEKVGSSEATLLGKLKITPFFFEILPQLIFEDGATFPVGILDIKESQLIEAFTEGNQKLTAFCLAANITCPSAVPYYLKDGFKNCCAICEAVSYTFPLFQRFSTAAATAVVAAPIEAPKKEEKKEEKKKEEPKEEPKKEEEEEEQDLGGLFDF